MENVAEFQASIERAGQGIAPGAPQVGTAKPRHPLVVRFSCMKETTSMLLRPCRYRASHWAATYDALITPFVCDTPR